MTITVANDKITANGNGVADTFSFSPIVIFTTIVSPDTVFDLEVTTRDANGVETLRSEGTGATAYAVVLTSTTDTLSSGSVRYPEAGGTLIPTGESITIRRKVTLLQQNDLENQGGYFPDIQEEAFDRAMMVAIQQQEELGRALTMPVGTLAAFSNILPPVVTGSRYLRTNSGLTAWELVELNSTGVAVASSSVPQGVALLTASAGTGVDYSREDHSHLVDAYIKFSADVHNALNFT